MKIVCGLFLAVLVYAQSQPPSPTPPIRGEKQQDQTAKKNTETNPNEQPRQSLPAINKGESQGRADATDGNAINIVNPPSLEDRIKITDWIIAGATVAMVILAIAQIVVYRKQSHHMLRGVRVSITQANIANKSAVAAKASADAAKFSADALIASERAWVVVSGVAPFEPHPCTTKPIEFLFDLANKGKTTARVMGLRSGATLLGEDQLGMLPKEPIYSDGPFGPQLPEHGRVLPPGEKIKALPIWYKRPLTEEEVAALKSKKMFLCFYGAITYIDFARHEREMRFCCLYTPDARPSQEWQNFHIFGSTDPDDQYNKHT